MFSQLETKRNRRWTVSHTVSLLLHCAVVYLLVRQPAPIFVQPSSVLAGFGGTSTAIVYLPAKVASGEHAAAQPHKPVALPAHLRQKSKPAPQPLVAPKAEGEIAKGSDVLVTRAGSPYGSLTTGPAFGHEIRPALPTAFHDPVVGRSQLPDGVQGDVVVEVTIDTAGNITDKRIIKALGYGVEEKVLAALADWRFHPATQDGVPIPSQQYVYFHFPS